MTSRVSCALFTSGDDTLNAVGDYYRLETRRKLERHGMASPALPSPPRTLTA
jgi:hypothetical protein